jgi:hypothetical protein
MPKPRKRATKPTKRATKHKKRKTKMLLIKPVKGPRAVKLRLVFPRRAG